MIINAGLLIDFGNSVTRVSLLASGKRFRFNMSNKFAELPGGYQVNNRYSSGNSTIFHCKGVFYANGQIVDREFSHTELRPSALKPKTDQLSTELTIHLAIIKSLNILSQANNTTVDNIDVTFNVSALLPPIDHEMHEERLVELFRSIEEVQCFIPWNFKAKVRIADDVNIQSEAVAAFFGACYTEEGGQENPDNQGKSADNGDVLVYDNGKHMNLVEVENNRKFFEGYVLVIDIGAGTTDIALFKDMELIESSKDTFNKGGNTVKSLMSAEIRKQFGYMPEASMMEDIMRTGQLAEGSTYHDIREIVTKAKRQYSSATMEHLQQYLERMSVALPIVKGLLVAGGGSLATVNPEGEEVSPPMAEVLVEQLKTLAPRLEAMDTEGKNLRELNIDGLGIIHKYS